MPIDPTRHRAIAALIAACDGFEWDDGNRYKNWLTHGVSETEAEEAFISYPLLLSDDVKHSQGENRYIALGTSRKNRKLSIAFTIRKTKIRIISARDMSEKDRREYGEEA
ncbi:MAG TPA: BrnT family toxin [Candidatus Kapabacteria bacterium]|nr:BrnT family toxin [Candidatus Kapabacteria bacterium]